MRIEKIIIEGFKTYSKRTEIGPFDKSFNAITGKNGSGKSNILDAIMFVLGATRATQLRVKDMAGLVYDKGNCVKGTVTIFFNNSDRALSPAGYEDLPSFTVQRTVKRDGSSKYLINGVQAPQAKIHALFHSVQLNIDNPTFLVQQGQITKVVNMKPLEVLAMLGEATGVRLYEEQREKAFKTLAQKQAKVDEMDRLLREEITPALEKRRAENVAFQKWQRNRQEVDKKKRFLVAYTYFQHSQTLDKARETELALESEMNQLRSSTEQFRAEAARIKDEKDGVLARRAAESGEHYQRLEDEESRAQRELFQAESNANHEARSLKEERVQLESLAKALQEATTAVERTRSAQVTAAADYDRVTQELQDLQLKAVSLGQRMEAAEAGVATGAGEGTGSLTDQLVAVKQALSKAQTHHKQLAMQLKVNRKERDEKQKQVGNSNAELEEAKRKVVALAKEKNVIQERMRALNFDPSQHAALVAESEQLRARIRDLEHRIDELAVKAQGGMDYRFQAPGSGFDRQKVHGRVGKLLTVKDSDACTALEVVAGAKLRNVVVDNEETARSLLKVNTQQRTTFIPLAQIRAEPLNDKARMAQQALGPDGNQRIWVATEKVDFSPAVRPAMDYVFGGHLVCKENDDAKRVAFSGDSRIVARCVSYDGDVCDPGGTLTGGSKGQLGDTLKVLSDLRALENERDQARARYHQVEQELRNLEMRGRQYGELKRDLELKEHELRLSDEKMQSSDMHQVVVRLRQLEEEIGRDERLLQDTEREEETCGAKVKELEATIKNFAKTKDEQIREMKSELAANKKKQVDMKKRQAQLLETRDTLVAELGSAEEELAQLKAQLDGCRTTVEKLEESVARSASDLERHRATLERIKAELVERRKLLARYDAELKQLSDRQNRVTEQLGENDVQAKQLEHRVQRFRKDTSTAQLTIQKMEVEHEWIKKESQFFGRAHTDYDFAAVDPQKAEADLHKLMNEQQKLEATINKKVASMIEEAERKYNDVLERKRIVEHDRQQIEATIDELDRKKVEALESTFEQVNRDFGNMFSKFLPGAFSVLKKQDGDILSGIEMRVRFGTTWKESLTELSGGQRSLLALSLILALCRYKPAPLYILDEIDAALDNSHTENIGEVIGREFSSSQFIVVSLKEGFYRTCNSLFEVELDESIQSSRVTRTARATATGGATTSAAAPATKKAAPVKGKAANNNNDDDDDDEDEAPRKVRGRK